MGYHLGVDLGTTFSSAAIERDGRVEIVTLGNRTTSVPSVLFLKDDNSILVGDAAERRGATEPERLAREFKRRVGDPAPVLLAGQPYGAEALMGRLLRWIVDRVTEIQGAAPAAVALTHPANWGPYKLDLLTQAARRVDVPLVRLISEPEAAAVAYAHQQRVEPGATVAVYDLGGGTFDIALLRRRATQAESFEILGQPDGIERLGGIDIDHAVFGFVRNALASAIDGLDPGDPNAANAMARLRRDCVDAKEALSADTDIAVAVALPTTQTEIRITRNELESLIRPMIGESIESVRRALRSAGLTPADVDSVLLVGGSSRIPLVAQMVGGELGRPVAVDANPKDLVALGAALGAAQSVGATAAAAPTAPAAPAAPPPTVPVAAPTPPPPAPAVPPPPAQVAVPAAHAAPPPTVPTAPAPASAPGGSRRGVVAVVAVVAALAAVAGGLLLTRDRGSPQVAADDTTTTSTTVEDSTTTTTAEPAGYTDAVRSQFISSCATSADASSGGTLDDPEGLCTCMMDAIEANVEFERFQEFDRSLRDDPDAQIPDDISEVVTPCFDEFSS